MAIFITALAVLLLVSLAMAHQRGHKKAGRLQPIPVKVELLSGSSSAGYPKLVRLLSALPVLEPHASTWSLVLAWTEEARKKGRRFGFGDLLIGAIAAEANAPVWSLDEDFARMRRLGFLQTHQRA